MSGTVPEESLKLYDKLLSTQPDIERKGKTMPYTSLNGNMFSFLDKDGKLGLRLSKQDREAFISAFSSRLMEQHGRIMKEYVEVPPELLKDTPALAPYLQKSFEYTSTLKAKPGKKVE